MNDHLRRSLKTMAIFSVLFLTYICLYSMGTNNGNMHIEPGKMTRPYNKHTISSKLLNKSVKIPSAPTSSYSTDLSTSQPVLNQSSSSDSYDVIQKSRIRSIRNACRNETIFKDQIYHGQFSLKYFISKDYNFSYCKVPKSGSTFWMQVFNILENELGSGAEIFDKERKRIHEQSLNHVSPFKKVKNDSFRTILVSRDPYSRLYSAYVDKVFVPIMPQLHTQVNQLGGNVSCQFNTSFQEFLDWVLHTGSKQTLNRHWAPIVSLCRPCEVNSFILVKQESFSKDVEFALKQVGVTGEKYDLIMSALYEHRVEFSLPGIIKTLFSTLDKSLGVKRCLDWKGFAERVWHSFKIQGYISEKIVFPEYLFTNNGRHSSSKTDHFIQVVLDTIKQRPLSSAESKKQRLNFLLNAYQGIHENTIKGIQDFYKQDFILYGYSNKPPRRDILV